MLVGLFADGLSTTALLSLLGAGVLLLFIGIALFSSRLVRPLAAVSDPIARWSVVVLTALIWPFFPLPYWLFAWRVGPGPRSRRAGSSSVPC